ncbi:hypothetical protein FQR44_06475 [Salmonella enterica]|nr:hypothetical protein [Salmonella enterica]
MRIFKTRWFNREAKSHTIKDDELSEAINAVLQGKADNTGCQPDANLQNQVV